MQLVGEIVPDVEGAPCLGGHNRTAGPDGAAPVPIPTVKMVDPELGISSDAVRRKCASLGPISWCLLSATTASAMWVHAAVVLAVLLLSDAVLTMSTSQEWGSAGSGVAQSCSGI